MFFVKVDKNTQTSLTNPSFIEISIQLSIALISFIIVGLSILVSFTDESFLSILKEVGVYDTIMFNFEFTAYIAISVGVLGIVTDAYESVLLSVGIYPIIFWVYSLLFVYMVLATANIVSVIVSIGARRAKIAR